MGASEQLLRRWHRPRDDPGIKGCFRRRFIKMEPAEDKVILEDSDKEGLFCGYRSKSDDFLDANSKLPLSPTEMPVGAEGSGTYLLLAPSVL